tara:strand:+ start:22 stop:192 length:171 start_codon:yes stop_codon:yes gene_type:complete
MTKLTSIKHTQKNFKILYDVVAEVSDVEVTSPARLGELKFLAQEKLEEIHNTQKKQ